MEHIRWKSLVVIKGNVRGRNMETMSMQYHLPFDVLRCSSERIWASLVHDAIGRNKGQVLVYLFTLCKSVLIKRYPFMLQCTLVEEVDSFENIFRKITSLEKVETAVVFLDSIDIISLDNSFDRVIMSLKEISQYATVIARMHDECISVQNWERLTSIAHRSYSLELRDMVTPLCTIVSYKADGKRNVKVVGTMHVDDSFHSFFKQYKAHDANIFAERNNNLPMPESSFDMGLNLRKSELEAKERVSLPYETAQKEEELVRLRVRENRKIRAGGRIIYTPDEADDFDESDPDDDLEI
uniref:Elongator complex protein 5 n=1 Tax=Elaeophora elaphi TaxID=1147741 RepID=A0A0R3RVK9_9BILA